MGWNLKNHHQTDRIDPLAQSWLRKNDTRDREGAWIQRVVNESGLQHSLFRVGIYLLYARASDIKGRVESTYREDTIHTEQYATWEH